MNNLLSTYLIRTYIAISFLPSGLIVRSLTQRRIIRRLALPASTLVLHFASIRPYRIPTNAFIDIRSLLNYLTTLAYRRFIIWTLHFFHS